MMAVVKLNYLNILYTGGYPPFHDENKALLYKKIKRGHVVFHPQVQHVQLLELFSTFLKVSLQKHALGLSSVLELARSVGLLHVHPAAAHKACDRVLCSHKCLELAHHNRAQASTADADACKGGAMHSR
jgi:hypothetical protein